MNDTKITTNNQSRFTLEWYELTAKEQKEFSYISNPDEGCGPFVRYRGWVYDMGDTMRVESEKLPADSSLQGWHGYVGHNYFSAVLFKYTDNECESVICATMTC